MTVAFDDTCSEKVACTSPKVPFIWITRPDLFDRKDLLHELGHRFDYQRMTERARNRFMRIMGIVGRDWQGQFDYRPNPPNEKFAEGWRMCAQNPLRPDRWLYGYGYKPTVKQHRTVCALIAAR